MSTEEPANSTASKTSDDSDLYRDWDPFKAEYTSYLNTFSYDQDDPIAIITGTKRLTAKHIPCKFFKFDSQRRTCGRFACPYLHDRSVALGVVKKDEQLATPRVLEHITLLSELPTKTPAPDGIINCGIVVSITDPGEFYVIPNGDWTCACKNVDDLDPEEHREEPNSGVKNLLSLWNDLDNEFQRITDQDSTYTINQLVAVRIKNQADRKKQWFRAVVLEDAIIGLTDELPVVKLRLLDFGTFLSSTIDNIVPLPRKLLRYPQLGYRCALNGINPITHRWSRRAIDAFRHLAHGQECIFEIKRTVLPQAEGDGIFEAVPHLVEVTVKLNGKYVNVTTELGNKGLGLLWNPFPTRPTIFKDVSNPRALALLMAKEPTHSIPIDAQILPHIFEREDGRLEKYLNRCHLKTLHSITEATKNDCKYHPGTLVGESNSQASSGNPWKMELNAPVRRFDTIKTTNDQQAFNKGSEFSSDTKYRREIGQISKQFNRTEMVYPESDGRSYPSVSDMDNNWRSNSRQTIPNSASEIQAGSHASTKPSVPGTSKKKQKWKKFEI